MSSFDVQALKDRLLVKYPAFASAIANANYYEKPVKTLCTDGKDIYYNPNFLNSLSFDEQLFVLAHEICHIRSNHILRSKDKNPKLWNIATDAVINTLLKDDGLLMPQKAVNMPDAIHYSAEEYYEKLLKEQEQNENSSSEENQFQSGQAQLSGSNGEEDSKEQNQKKSSQGTGEDEEYNNPSNIDDHSMWTKALENENNDVDSNEHNEENVDEQELFSQNRKEKIKNLKKLKDELLRQSMKAGKELGKTEITINDIGDNKPLIDWRTLLRKSINVKLRWDTKRPEVEYGVLVPKLKRKAYPRTEILLDTSGSIDDEMLKNFLRECKYILQNTEMWVGCFDTKFYGFQKIDTEEDIDKMTFYGRGGTNFEVAVQTFSKRVDNKIIFTDGIAQMPDTTIDAIWIVFGGCKIDPKGGKVIYINEEQLRKLQSVNRFIKR